MSRLQSMVTEYHIYGKLIHLGFRTNFSLKYVIILPELCMLPFICSLPLFKYVMDGSSLLAVQAVGILNMQVTL